MLDDVVVALKAVDDVETYTYILEVSLKGQVNKGIKLLKVAVVRVSYDLDGRIYDVEDYFQPNATW